MKWKLVYQDYKDGPEYTFSEHRSQRTAEVAKKKVLRDPYWRGMGYIFSVKQEQDAAPA